MDCVACMQRGTGEDDRAYDSDCWVCRQSGLNRRARKRQDDNYNDEAEDDAKEIK